MEHIDLQEDIVLPDHESESTQSNPDRDLFSEECALSDSFFSSERNPLDQEMTSLFQPFKLPLSPFPNPFSNPNPNIAAISSNGKEISINKPTPFTGDRKKIGTFIQETKVYLTINRDVYNTNEKRIAFMLSYMTDKEALQWKELYLEILTDQTTGNIVFPSYAKFLNDLKEVFKAADRTGEAMNKLTNLRQGNKTAEEVATEFQLLAGQAGLEKIAHSDNLHLIGLFRNTLRPTLSRQILFRKTIPKTFEE